MEVKKKKSTRGGGKMVSQGININGAQVHVNVSKKD